MSPPIGSLVSQSSSDPIGGDIGNHVNFQGALYTVNDFDMDNNTTVGARCLRALRRSTTLHSSKTKPPFPIQYMYGLPAATQSATTVQAVQGSYAGDAPP